MRAHGGKDGGCRGRSAQAAGAEAARFSSLSRAPGTRGRGMQRSVRAAEVADAGSRAPAERGPCALKRYAVIHSGFEEGEPSPAHYAVRCLPPAPCHPQWGRLNEFGEPAACLLAPGIAHASSAACSRPCRCSARPGAKPSAALPALPLRNDAPPCCRCRSVP